MLAMRQGLSVPDKSLARGPIKARNIRRFRLLSKNRRPGRSFVELIYYGSGNVLGGQGMQLIQRCNEFEVVSRRRIEA